MKPETESSRRRILAAERQRDALNMRLTGARFREIGLALGFSESAACRAVNKALNLLRAEIGQSADALRTLEGARLDSMLRAIWPAIEQGNLGAIGRAVTISGRRAALFGLDAPLQTHLSGVGGEPLIPVNKPPFDFVAYRELCAQMFGHGDGQPAAVGEKVTGSRLTGF